MTALAQQGPGASIRGSAAWRHRDSAGSSRPAPDLLATPLDPLGPLGCRSTQAVQRPLLAAGRP